MKKIHVGFLLSYDYEYLKKSIPMVYEEADAIFLALDENQRTWKGNRFEIDNSFFEWIGEIDKDNKIEIYKDNFYKPELSTIQNDTRERYLLGLKMGLGNWIIQVDSDEIIIDFKGFVRRLRGYDNYLNNPIKHPIQFAAYHINVYKYLEDGLLYVDMPSKFLLATNYPNYKYAKNTKSRIVYLPTYALHEGLARTEEELKMKLVNWGHSHEINNTFLGKWQKANKTNYKEIKDVFYLDPKTWPSLGYLPITNFEELKYTISKDSKLKVLWHKMFLKNFGQWFKHLFKKSNVKFESYF